ncbi:MAG: SurA N-terminal domain-containing protein [Desulfosalsimonas sp.]
MLSSMRKNAGSWMIKILLGLIVLAFVFMGAGTFYSRRDTEVAKVNGEHVTSEEYQRTYQNAVENLRQRFGDGLDQDTLDTLNIEEQVLNQLIEKRLLLQTAEQNHIMLTDEILAGWITSIQAFQNNGQFDPNLYKRVLSRNRLSPESFEAMQKQNLLENMVRNFAGNAVPVAEEEARAWFEWRNTEVNIEYAVFSAKDFKDVEISQEETEEYFEENREAYRSPPRRKARYVRFNPEDYLDQVSVSQSEVSDYYDSNRSEFTEPETVEARHILLEVPQDADTETEEKTRKKALEIIEKAESDEDFSELARRFSEDQTAEEGGYLGTLEKGDTVKEFSEAAFSLEPGEISKPVRTKFGWHIIKIEDRTEESVRPLAEVKGKIREKLGMEKATDLAHDEAFSVYNISFEGDDLVENSEEMGLELKTTDFFERNSGPDINGTEKFAETAFSLSEGEISEVTQINDSFYLIQPVEKQKPGIPELDSVIEEVREDALREKRKLIARQTAESLLEQLGSEESLSDVPGTNEYKVETTGFFKRNQAVPGIGQNRPLSSAAFSLREDKPIADSVIDGDDDKFYVIGLKDRKTPGDSAFENEKQDVIAEFKERKRRQMLDKWTTALRQRSDIEISDKFSDPSG